MKMSWGNGPHLAAQPRRALQEMPDCDGHECASRLRSRGVLCPIVGVTGNVLDVDRSAFLAAGASAVVTKPVRMGELEAVLEALGLRFPTAARRGSGFG